MYRGSSLLLCGKTRRIRAIAELSLLRMLSVLGVFARPLGVLVGIGLSFRFSSMARRGCGLR